MPNHTRPSVMTRVVRGPLHLSARVIAAVVAGYGFTWGCTALSAALLVAAGMDLREAMSLATMLGFLVYLAVCCWTFAAQSLARVWLALAGGGAAMTGLATLLSRMLD